MPNYIDSSGRNVSLGSRIGSGGEGDVFEVLGIDQNLVAKIYHRPIQVQKQEKLRVMVQGCNESLKKVSAWPTSTLHSTRSGPICGFLMPRISGFEPIHKLYGPSHRKQFFPHADWAFLINAAQNVSSTFETLHALGHVVGDVNQGNVLVASNSTVRLIDCDSFQIRSNGNLYGCEVGVPHYTPPELQNTQSFHAIERTANHDNFGLALLCFHLLFMGRHPFCGIYDGNEDMPIEKAIKTFRFAFGSQSHSRNLSPPPNCVTMAIIPLQLASLFERAFTESGATSRKRPTAHEWREAFNDLRNSLVSCSQQSTHKYYRNLPNCPWCGLEQKTGIIFFIGVFQKQTGQVTFNLELIWQKIKSIPSPGDAPPIDFGQLSVTPRPLPPEIENQKVDTNIKRFLALLIVIAMLAIYPPSVFIGLIIAYFLCTSGMDYGNERRGRQATLNDTQQRWNQIEQRWKREAGEGLFKEKLAELAQYKEQYEKINGEYAKDKQYLHSTVRERQLRKYLETFFIEDHKIPNIGPARKAVLASFGIETAADIEYNKVIRLKGFGPSRTKDLEQWRKKMEQNFKFDSAKGIDPADLSALNQIYTQKRSQIENKLLGGTEVLNKIRLEALQKRTSLQVEVISAARLLAQARVDMQVF